jgi:RimJ/RimL family protein N-acetyltransferase
LRTRKRTEGTGLCFAVTLTGYDTGIGIFQVRATGLEVALSEGCPTKPDFSIAEWGFALGSPFWGTGVFEEAAHLVLGFVFEALCVHRLEASAAVRNGRGNRALVKVGAVQEGILRRSLFCGGRYLDEAFYAIVEDDWRAQRSRPHRATVRVH